MTKREQVSEEERKGEVSKREQVSEEKRTGE